MKRINEEEGLNLSEETSTIHCYQREPLSHLVKYLFPLVNDSESPGKKILVTGGRTGEKKEIICRLGNLLKHMSKVNQIQREGESYLPITYVYVDCSHENALLGRWYYAMTKIIRTLRPGFPSYGYNYFEAFQMYRTYFLEQPFRLLICLDHLDKLLTSKDDLNSFHEMIQQFESGYLTEEVPQISWIFTSHNKNLYNVLSLELRNQVRELHLKPI